MSAELHGLLAEFNSPEDLLAAIRRVRAEGYRNLDAFTPWPIEGVAEALGFEKTGIAPIVLAGGIAGGLIGYFMQFYTTAIDYPMNVGGRPLHSWPAYIAITFELTVLGAALAGFAGMLILNRLPKLHHPLFNSERFEKASVDGFFLCINAADPAFGEATQHLLEEAQAVGIWKIGK